MTELEILTKMINYLAKVHNCDIKTAELIFNNMPFNEKEKLYMSIRNAIDYKIDI